MGREERGMYVSRGLHIHIHIHTHIHIVEYSFDSLIHNAENITDFQCLLDLQAF